MKVKFLRGFRGRETNEVYFEEGQIVDGPKFSNLAERGIVEIIPDPVDEPIPTHEPAPQPAPELEEVVIHVDPKPRAKKGGKK